MDNDPREPLTLDGDGIYKRDRKQKVCYDFSMTVIVCRYYGFDADNIRRKSRMSYFDADIEPQFDQHVSGRCGSNLVASQRTIPVDNGSSSIAFRFSSMLIFHVCNTYDTLHRTGLLYFAECDSFSGLPVVSHFGLRLCLCANLSDGHRHDRGTSRSNITITKHSFDPSS
jgi:hypothetical protein